jgi:hypothetical protein
MSQQYPPQYPQYQQYPPPYPPPAPQTSTAAVIGLIASILGIIGFLPLIGSIVGIIAGNSAKNDIRNRPGQVTGDGIAQASVIVGWIGLALWGIGCCIAAVALAMGFAIPGVSICAALGSGNTISWLQLAPIASVLIVPIALMFKR